MRINTLDANTAAQLDIAIGDQIAGPHIDVVTRATAQVFQKQARLIVTEIEHKARVFEFLVKLSVALFNRLKRRALEVRQHFVRNGGKQQVGFFVGQPASYRLFRVERPQHFFHQ